MSSVEAYPAEPLTAAGSRRFPQVTGVLLGERQTRRRQLWTMLRAHPTAVALGLLVAVLVAASLLGNALLTTGPSRPGKATDARSAGGSTAGKQIAIQSASVVGGSDHPEELRNVTDSNASSAWYTEHYATAAFGGLKNGVGLRLQISSSAPVRSVDIHFAVTGIAAKLYAGDSLSSLQGAKPLGVVSSAPGEWRLTLPSPVKAHTWLIWISHLAADSGGYRAGVGDVRLLS